MTCDKNITRSGRKRQRWPRAGGLDELKRSVFRGVRNTISPCWKCSRTCDRIVAVIPRWTKKLDGNSLSWDIELLTSKRTDNNGKHFKFYASLFISVIWIEGKQNTNRTSASTEKKISASGAKMQNYNPKTYYIQFVHNIAIECVNFTTY